MHVPTSYGIARGKLLQLDDKTVFIMSRHGLGHKLPPHRVNYRAMAQALHNLGVRACFGTAAVGSLRKEWGAGTFVLCNDFLDLTGRNLTLFDRKVVHTDFSCPFGVRGSKALQEAADSAGVPLERGLYVCGNGPRYETPREIALYAKWGGDLIGMTAATEAILMREAGVDYTCLAIVTNLACGLAETPLSHGEVEDAMGRSAEKAVNLLLSTIGRLRL